MANVTFNLNFIQDKADTNSADSAVNIKVDGATVASGAAVTSTDADSPTTLSFTVNDLTEASHSMEIEFTNPYYVDSTDYRKIDLLGCTYTTAYDTYKDGVQKSNQDKMIARDRFPATENVRDFKATWTALTNGGEAVPNSGDTAWTSNSHYMYDESLVITFTYANNSYNVYPYRAVLDAGTSPPTLSTTITIPYGDEGTTVSSPIESGYYNASGAAVQFAAE